MADIFLSYAHEDQPAAKRIVDALAREGLDAWWDHEIPPGRSWDEVIGTRIGRAKVVIVIWSAKSVGSNFVKEEAQLALDAGKLLPVKVAEVEPPVGFRRTHAANLADWRGQADHRQWRALLTEIRDRLGDGAPAAQSYAPPPSSRANSMKMAPIMAGVGALVAVGVVGYLLINREPPSDVKYETAGVDSAVEQTTTGMSDGPLEKAGEVSQEPASPPQTDARTVELQFWRSCCDRTNAIAEDFREYLAHYPLGEFSPIAQRRLRELTQPPPPVFLQLAGRACSGQMMLEGGGASDVRITFRPNGTAEWYNISTASRIEWAGWSQSGSSVQMNHNDGSTFSGALSGSQLVGTFAYGDRSVTRRLSLTCG